jgi:hypothetical protein
MAITVTGGPAYGLAWNKTTDAYTRVASAAGLTAGANFNAPSAGAWVLRRCNLWDDGTPTAYYGDTCFSDTGVATGGGEMGQVMVQVPKFYYYREYNAGTTTYYWFVTTTAATTIDVGLGVGAQAVKIHPAFTRNSVTKANIYLSAYEGYYNTSTTMLESKSGVKPSTTPLSVGYAATIANLRTAAHLRAGAVADKWEIQDYLTTCAVQLLYLIEYGGFHSSALLSAGVTDITDDGSTNMAINTGYTSALGNASGQVTVTHYQTSETTHAMSYRGIENFYGNIHKHIDGINIKADRNPWIADHGFANDTFAAPYVDTTLTLYNTSDFLGDIATNATYDYGFLPSAGGGSGTTKLCDYYMQSTGNLHPIYGGRWGWGVYAFGVLNNSAASNATRDVGSRLMYIG